MSEIDPRFPQSRVQFFSVVKLRRLNLGISIQHQYFIVVVDLG